MSFSFQLSDLLHPGSDEDERLKKQRAAGAPPQPQQPTLRIPYRPPEGPSAGTPPQTALAISRWLSPMLPPSERRKASFPSLAGASPFAPQQQSQQSQQQPQASAPVVSQPAVVASPGVEAGAPGLPAAPLQPSMSAAGQTDIAENLRRREQHSRQRQDQMLGQGAEQARQLAQQEPLLQPARQRLEAARQAHAALAGAPVRYETRDGGDRAHPVRCRRRSDRAARRSSQHP